MIKQIGGSNMFVSNDEFRQNGEYSYGEDINIDINNYNTNTNSNYNMNDMNMMNADTTMMGSVQGPIVEPGRERVVQRNIIHEIKHICPMNTKIINNHIFRHTYEPRYTCCEENTCTNIQCGSCCNFN